jgi:uncharacterized iron-regulated protein
MSLHHRLTEFLLLIQMEEVMATLIQMQAIQQTILTGVHGLQAQIAALKANGGPVSQAELDSLYTQAQTIVTAIGTQDPAPAPNPNPAPGPDPNA